MKIFENKRLIIIIALVILLGISIFEQGINVLLIAAVATAGSLFVELLATKIRKEKYDFSSYFITPLVFSLIITTSVKEHVWMVALGVMFGIFFAKSLFGGQDKNIFNPAALGLIFVILSFPAYVLNQGTGNAMGELFVYSTLGLALILILLKAVSAYTLISYLASLFLMYGVLNLINGAYLSINEMLFGTHIIFVGVFMATEKSSGPNHKISQVIYGFTLGFLVWLINNESSNAEFAAVYSIILANALAPLIDSFVNTYILKLNKPEELKEVTT